LDQTLGALDGELGDRRVVVGRAVEGRRDDLALDGTLHVRNFLGTFVDEDDHEVRFGVVLGDRIRDLLHDRGLTGLRGRDDETALALADGRDEVDQTRRVQLRGGLQPQALLRVERGELRELDAAASIVDGQSVDGGEAGVYVGAAARPAGGPTAVAAVRGRRTGGWSARSGPGVPRRPRAARASAGARPRPAHRPLGSPLGAGVASAITGNALPGVSSVPAL